MKERKKKKIHSYEINIRHGAMVDPTEEMRSLFT